MPIADLAPKIGKQKKQIVWQLNVSFFTFYTIKDNYSIVKVFIKGLDFENIAVTNWHGNCLTNIKQHKSICKT